MAGKKVYEITDPGRTFLDEHKDVVDDIFERVHDTVERALGGAMADMNRAVGRLVKTVYRAGWRGPVFLVDDNFIGNKKNVKILLPRLVEWMRDHRFPFSLFTEASVNLAEDPDLLRLMREAHFTRVFLGIETPVEESLNETTKFQNLRQDLLESVKLIQSYGIEVMAGFIVGFDNDPPDVFERQIRFIREAAIPLSMVGLLTALPNTQLWRRLTAEGRLLKQSLGNNTLFDLNFIPRMNPQELLDGYKRILETIYSPGEYFERASAFLSKLGASAHTPIVWADVMAVFRSFYRQGLFSNYRREYWKFIAETARRHREHFDKAMTLAIMGHHFFELTGRAIAKAQSAIEDGYDPWVEAPCSEP